MAPVGKPGIDLRPGPFLKVAANRLDVSSRRGFPVTVAWVLSGVFFLGFLSIAEGLVGSFSVAVDRMAASAVAAVAGPAMTRVMWAATLLGNTSVAVAATLAAALVLAVWGHPRRAGSVVILMLVGGSLSQGLKFLMERPRPPADAALIAIPTSMSFPSGHAMAGIVLAGTLALMLFASRVQRPVRVAGGIAILLIGLTVGMSRVYLGVHFFSDVLASWCLGATLVGLWAAAVLTWGRPVSSEPGTDTVSGPRWSRWVLTVAAPLAVIGMMMVEAGLTPLR